LLTLERVEKGETLNNITSVILVIVGEYGGLMMNKNVASKCICLGFNVDSLFLTIHIGMITQTMEWIASYFIGVHCVAHWTNLVVMALSKLS
jgi:hypothetical protein